MPDRQPEVEVPTPLPLAVQLFGPLRVLVGGEPMPRVPTRSVGWLLSLLILRHGRTVHRSWLAGTLWPDSEERQALHNLRDMLVHLRKALGPERERIQAPSRDTLSLALEGADVDVLRFDTAMKAGDERSLHSAVSLYSGPLLEGCYEAWVAPERGSREQACLMALERLAVAAEERRDYGRALMLLRRAEGIDALCDTTRRVLMRVLAAGGDAPAALDAYRQYRARLLREMDIEPDEETIRLYQQIRQQAQQPPGRKVERRKASSTGGAWSAGRPLVPPFCFPASLPHPLTALIGRDQETCAIVQALSRSRLVTLVGMGGVGKTRLAIQAAQELARCCDEGAVFVPLASLSDPALLPACVASALGIPEAVASEAADRSQALSAWLTTHEVLLVLDNCEHLTAAAASLIQALLERCPNLHILATSRQRLGLIGETVWRVPLLPSPDPGALREEARGLVEAVLTYPAVRLFVERAAMVRPGFQLTEPEDALAIAEICHRLDGIPLAIELAAARMGALSVGQIVSRLSDPFRLLRGGCHAALPHQQSLRSMIDRSYDLLTPGERVLFCRLSVFTGGWTLPAAEAVAGCRREKAELRESSHHPLVAVGPEDVLDLLASLVDKSLVIAEDGRAAHRYRMLETVRAYAAEKLRESSGERGTRHRHLAYYLDQAQASAQIVVGCDPAPALRLLATEVSNLRAALGWAQTLTPSYPGYLRLATSLARLGIVQACLASPEDVQSVLAAASRCREAQGIPRSGADKAD